MVAPQFASIPRFNVSRTTPHQIAASHQPPPFSTPAQSSAKYRATQCEPLSDSIETSPISTDLLRDNDWGALPLDESIEFDSQSPSVSGEDDGERPQKRRRVSISPVVDATPNDDEESLDQQRDYLENPSSPSAPPIRNPTFLSAPRFKAIEAVKPNQNHPPLPDAFSPQRRGTKYVPGGLAAEVRNWLVQVKGANEYDRPAGECVQFTVGQVMACYPDGMCLVSGRENEDEDEEQDTSNGLPTQGGGEKDQPAKVILAGEGRIVGLESRSPVTPGETLSFFQPMWDIALSDLGRFAVVCNWT